MILGDICYSLNTCKNYCSKKYTELLLYLSFSFFFHFLASQTTSKNDFSGDEWLGFTFLRVMEVR